MQIRKQKDLEIALQKLAGFVEPKANLEQYMTPAGIAADVLFTAYGLGDIGNMRVADLGCGTGILAIGAKLLGARRVSGFDVDAGAIEIAKHNAISSGMTVEFSEMDVSGVAGSFDTVLMNPPFGAQKKHADRPFFEKAAELAPVVWTFCNSGTAEFVEKLMAGLGFRGNIKKIYKFEVRHMYEHHTRERMYVDVAMMRFVKEGDMSG